MGKRELISIGLGIFLLATLGTGLLFLSGQSAFVQPPKKPENFTYRLGKCRQPGTDNSINLSKNGGSIKFNQIFNTYCNAQDALILTYALSGKNIEIREIFESSVVARAVSRCVCSFEIEGQINNLRPGGYNLKFIYDNRYSNQVEILEEKQFELK